VWLVNGSSFQYPGGAYTPTNLYYAGWIAGETRKANGATYDAFTTTTPLPTGTALRNEFLSVTHGALSDGTTNVSEMYRIDQVVFTNGLYHVCFTNDHDLEITNGTVSVEQVAPLRTFTGSNSFEIALSGSASAAVPSAPVAPSRRGNAVCSPGRPLPARPATFKRGVASNGPYDDRRPPAPPSPTSRSQ
jgi:hypothetical protein